MLISILSLIYIYMLIVFKRKKLDFFYFFIGSVGFFMIVIFSFRGILAPTMIKFLSACMGIIGKITGKWTAYKDYGVIFIDNGFDTISLNIDYECSGMIECLVYISLVLFFPVYNILQRIKVLLFGSIYILITNIIRLCIICYSIYFYGNQAYYISHTIIGRLVFFIFTICLYFFTFTKVQIKKQNVGNFDY